MHQTLSNINLLYGNGEARASRTDTANPMFTSHSLRTQRGVSNELTETERNNEYLIKIENELLQNRTDTDQFGENLQFCLQLKR